jgi:hypothetical protein
MIDHVLDKGKNKACSVSLRSIYSHVQYYISKSFLKIQDRKVKNLDRSNNGVLLKVLFSHETVKYWQSLYFAQNFRS